MPTAWNLHFYQANKPTPYLCIYPCVPFLCIWKKCLSPIYSLIKILGAHYNRLTTGIVLYNRFLELIPLAQLKLYVSTIPYFLSPQLLVTSVLFSTCKCPNEELSVLFPIIGGTLRIRLVKQKKIYPTSHKMAQILNSGSSSLRPSTSVSKSERVKSIEVWDKPWLNSIQFWKLFLSATFWALVCTMHDVPLSLESGLQFFILWRFKVVGVLVSWSITV